MNRPWRTTLIVGAMSGLAMVGVIDGFAQTPNAPVMRGTQEIEGKVRDVGNERITLEDGTVLAVPKGLAKQPELKVGAAVKAKYQERNGQKVATSIIVNPAAESGTGASSGTK